MQQRTATTPRVPLPPVPPTTTGALAHAHSGLLASYGAGALAWTRHCSASLALPPTAPLLLRLRLPLMLPLLPLPLLMLPLLLAALPAPPMPPLRKCSSEVMA